MDVVVSELVDEGLEFEKVLLGTTAALKPDSATQSRHGIARGLFLLPFPPLFRWTYGRDDNVILLHPIVSLSSQILLRYSITILHQKSPWLVDFFGIEERSFIF